MTDPAPLNSADYLIATLYAYMYNKDVSLQNDCVLWDNGLSLRRAEPYDYLDDFCIAKLSTLYIDILAIIDVR